MSGSLQLASVKEAAGNETAEQMVSAVVNDFKLVIEELKLVMELAESAKDETSADLLLGIHSALEKHVLLAGHFDEINIWNRYIKL